MYLVVHLPMQIADLLNTMRDYRALAPNLSRVLDYTERDVQLMQVL